MDFYDVKKVIFRQFDCFQPVALMSVLFVDEDAYAGTPVLRVEVENVDGTDGFGCAVFHYHKPLLPVAVQPLRRCLDEFFQQRLGIGLHRVADFPVVHIVLPFVEDGQIGWLHGPEMYFLTIH